MDFFAIILFLGFYIIRPHEWIPFLEALHPVSLVIYMSILGMLLRKPGFSLKHFLKTPHDFAMLAFLLWIVCTGDYWRADFEKVKSQFLFYFLVVLALYNLERIEKFLAVWAGLLVTIAALAIASEYGFDPANSYENTHGMFMGRLVFHNSIYNNPNGLGHGIVPAVGMIYFFCFWKRPIFIKEIGICLLAITFWCSYLTQSKGAFLSGFAAIVTTLCFGRAKSFQILILVLSLTIGFAGLQALPRMEEMHAPRQDAGIRGRLDAFKYGLEKLKANRYGIGLFTFADHYQRDYGIFLSPHSSYVGMGAELGWMGFFFYLGVFYCSIRVLVTAKTTTPQEERVRRILMVLNISFMVSTWMINWGHQAQYWFIAAVTAAFHRHLLSKAEPVAVAAAPEPPIESPLRRNSTRPFRRELPQPAMAMARHDEETETISVETVAPAGAAAVATAPEPLTGFAAILERRAKNKPDATAAPATGWRRVGLIDLALIWAMTHYTVEFWSYIVTHL